MCSDDRLLSKISEGLPSRPIRHDFLAGIDPTGTSTFQYGMHDSRDGGNGSGIRRAANTVGGLLGGAAVMPAAIGGLIGGVRGVTQGAGNWRSHLLSGAKGFLQGAKAPYSNLYGGIRASQALKAHQAGGRLSDKQIQQLSKYVTGQLPMKQLVPSEMLNSSNLREKLYRLAPDQIGKMQHHLKGDIASGIGSLGLSGLVSGGSAYQQYGKGVQVQQDVNQQLGKTAMDAEELSLMFRLARKRGLEKFFPKQTVFQSVEHQLHDLIPKALHYVSDSDVQTVPFSDSSKVALHRNVEDRKMKKSASLLADGVLVKIGGLIPGGKADEAKITAEDVDAKQLQEGIKVEKEHTPSNAKAKEISLDHLTEFPDYYTRLSKMEQEAEKAKENKQAADASQSMLGTVREYLKGLKKSPEDEDFHTWAESKGFDKHKAEEAVYALARSAVQAKSTK